MNNQPAPDLGQFVGAPGEIDVDMNGAGNAGDPNAGHVVPLDPQALLIHQQQAQLQQNALLLQDQLQQYANLQAQHAALQDAGRAIHGCRRRYQGALKNAPRFKEGVAWRTFLMAWRNWSVIAGFNDPAFVGDGILDEKKGVFIALIDPSLLTRIESMMLGSPTWTAALTLEDFVAQIGEVYQPAIESQVARSEFEMYIQVKDQDVQKYITTKIALFHAAHAPANRDHHRLVDCSIDGLYNKIVKRYVRHSTATTTEHELIQTVIEVTAKERESVKGGYGESANYGGLSCVTATASQAYGTNGGPEAMELGKFGDRGGKFSGNCHRCNHPGHRKTECRTLEKNFKKKPAANPKKKEDKTSAP